MKRSFLLLCVILLFVLSCTNSVKEYKTMTAKDANGYSYEYVVGDDSNTRVYTLENGLKIYLSVNKDEPRISTYIAVNAGGKHDPRETTGLAHYYEHMVFKGTHRLGTLNWEKESPLIQEISDLYEEYGKTTEVEKRDSIYALIDSVSTEASKYAVANEYDKVCALMGASGTNAWTSYEETVYVNEIPSNELERWAYLEKERFETLVLRLFHTEIETVYEEFNGTQDSDGRRVSAKLMELFFKNHPYNIPVIGKAEHLKNPSMVNIMKFKEDYYVPNNVAICLSGDLDIENTVKIIDKYWGELKPNKNIPEFSFVPEEDLKEIKEVDVLGPEKENVIIAFRMPGKKSKEVQYLNLISSVLSNSGAAGLIDLNLTKKQKIMSAYAYTYALNDYGLFEIIGYPREGQSLEEVKELLLEELNKVKNGEFEDWLLEAIIDEARLNRIRTIDNNLVARDYVRCFIAGKTWLEHVQELDELAKITKSELIDFANEFFENKYVVIYKRQGQDENIVHIEKPKITPLEINRDAESEFVKEFKEIKIQDINPVFIDYKDLIKKEKIVDGVELNYIKNETNELFNCYYIFEMGKDNFKKLPIAIDYLRYLGTKDKTVEDLQIEWYKMGVSFNVSSSKDRSTVSISGLDNNFGPAISLLEEIFLHVHPNQEVYDEYVNGLIKRREGAKFNSRTILWDGLVNYSKYKEKSSFSDVLTEEELRNIDPNELVDIIKSLLSYKHSIFYYGPRQLSDVADVITAKHNLKHEFKELPEKIVYEEASYDSRNVYFINYNMVRSSILFVGKDQIFDKYLIAISRLYNEYYGGSMAGIVFQEIREAKGLVYSCSAQYATASTKEDSNFSYASLSCQNDKMTEALKAITDLLDEMPESEDAFNLAKEAIIKRMNSERIIKDQVFWQYQQLKKLGFDFDIRKNIYYSIHGLSLKDLKTFFNQHISGKNYDLLIVGDREKIDFEMLKKYGNVKELSLEEVFNY